jgi:hypothetical protein
MQQFHLNTGRAGDRIMAQLCGKDFWFAVMGYQPSGSSWSKVRTYIT